MKTLCIIILLSALIFDCESAFAQHPAVSQALSSTATENISNRYALKGTLVTPTEIIPGGTLFVVGDRIEALEKDIKLPSSVKIIETNAFIYPGLIDLHNHITWNFLPHWKAGETFNNRYEWQVRNAYLVALKGPHDQFVAPSPRSSSQEDLACDANRYGEVKAIIGGATSVADSLGADDCVKELVRNLDSYSGLYPPGTSEKLWNKVFPLELSNDEVRDINQGLADSHHALVAHLAEGKQRDASSAREFVMFKARGFLRDGVSIIHGVALSPSDFKEMASNRVGLIWSPRSNIEMYGETTNVRTAKASGVKIALAPDWSPTGSDGVLEELTYAAAWNSAQNPRVFTEAELVKMVTIYPAELAKLDDKIGSLAPQHFADLLVVRSDMHDPYRALLSASPTDVRLVVIGGNAIYGDEDLMHSLAPLAEFESVRVCDATKLLSLASEKTVQPKPPKAWTDTVAALRKALKASGLTLSELASCPSKQPLKIMQFPTTLSIGPFGFEKDIRWLIVGFLYAVAIAEVAVQSAKLASYEGNRKPYLPAIFHLVLITVVITTSWVGWTMAISRESSHIEHHLTKVFSWQYCLLLIDVGLLISYFIIAKKLEMPEPEDGQSRTREEKTTFWLMIVFFGYCLWDFVHYGPVHHFNKFWFHMWPTALCLLIIAVTWLILRFKPIKSSRSSIFLYIWLIAVVFLFRFLKATTTIQPVEESDAAYFSSLARGGGHSEISQMTFLNPRPERLNKPSAFLSAIKNHTGFC
jgi:5-methylthioadenosine/S-adenosylhomocysteine deaminase